MDARRNEGVEEATCKQHAVLSLTCSLSFRTSTMWRFHVFMFSLSLLELTRTWYSTIIDSSNLHGPISSSHHILLERQRERKRERAPSSANFAGFEDLYTLHYQ
jgi:hypothetical protein